VTALAAYKYYLEDSKPINIQTLKNEIKDQTRVAQQHILRAQVELNARPRNQRELMEGLQL
jgi:hypothetical protein